MSGYLLCTKCAKCDAFNPKSRLCICLKKLDVVVMPLVTKRSGLRRLCPHFTPVRKGRQGK